MSKKIMSWIDAMPGVDATDFPAQRDQVVAMMNEAAELARKAEALRAKAYVAGCSLEGNAKVHWSIEVVERAKARIE